MHHTGMTWTPFSTRNMVNLLLMYKVCHECVRLRYDFRHDLMLYPGDVSSQGFLLGS